MAGMVSAKRDKNASRVYHMGICSIKNRFCSPDYRHVIGRDKKRISGIPYPQNFNDIRYKTSFYEPANFCNESWIESK